MFKRAAIIAFLTLLISIPIQAQDSEVLSCIPLSEGNSELTLSANHPLIVQPQVGGNFRIVNHVSGANQELPRTANIQSFKVLNMPDSLLVLREVGNGHVWQTVNYTFDTLRTVQTIEGEYTLASFRQIAHDSVWIDAYIDDAVCVKHFETTW